MKARAIRTDTDRLCCVGLRPEPSRSKIVRANGLSVLSKKVVARSLRKSVGPRSADPGATDRVRPRITRNTRRESLYRPQITGVRGSPQAADAETEVPLPAADHAEYAESSLYRPRITRSTRRVPSTGRGSRGVRGEFPLPAADHAEFAEELRLQSTDHAEYAESSLYRPQITRSSRPFLNAVHNLRPWSSLHSC